MDQVGRAFVNFFTLEQWIMANPSVFKIPKQTDRSLLDAFFKIREAVKDYSALIIDIQVNEGGRWFRVSEDGELSDDLNWFLNESSELFCRIVLATPQTKDQSPRALNFVRKAESPFDHVEVTFDLSDSPGNWLHRVPKEQRELAHGKFLAAARRHLRAADADASLAGSSDSDWSRYRDSQLGVLNSLQETTKTILVETSLRATKEEQRLQEKHSHAEKRLHDEVEAERKANLAEHERIVASLAEREAELQKRAEAFNTKEARYVARSIQKDQIDDLKLWISNLSLTSESKWYRWPVHAICIGAILASCVFAWQSSIQTSEYLTRAGSLNTPLLWWQWLALLVKPAIAFAAFVSFSIYYIRWSATWAHRLSEEDMRNRVRLLDVGRSQWLLEAVRDSQDHKTELPVELIKELSRNLFTHSPGATGNESDAGAVGKALMQGLSSIRVKAPDGSEIEAKNEESKPAK